MGSVMFWVPINKIRVEEIRFVPCANDAANRGKVGFDGSYYARTFFFTERFPLILIYIEVRGKRFAEKVFYIVCAVNDAVELF